MSQHPVLYRKHDCNLVYTTTQEWSDRGKGLETLTRRLREEGARRDEEREELETAAAAAREEAEARGEEVARLAVDFETRAACAEAGMDEKVGLGLGGMVHTCWRCGGVCVLVLFTTPGSCLIFWTHQCVCFLFEIWAHVFVQQARVLAVVVQQASGLQ